MATWLEQDAEYKRLMGLGRRIEVKKISNAARDISVKDSKAHRVATAAEVKQQNRVWAAAFIGTGKPNHYTGVPGRWSEPVALAVTQALYA